MKTKDYLMYLISYILNFITFTLCSLNFLARKLPVLFAFCVIGDLLIILIIYLCIKEIRTRDSDLEENKNGIKNESGNTEK